MGVGLRVPAAGGPSTTPAALPPPAPYNCSLTPGSACHPSAYHNASDLSPNPPASLIPQKYNDRSDIWSLGCVLYEMTTLKHAFDANSLQLLIHKIVKGNFPEPPAKYSK